MPKITWPVVVVVISLLASIDVALFATDNGGVVGPLVNIIGVILVAMFARDTVTLNKESANRTEEAARQATETVSNVLDLKSDVEHQATVARIAALEAMVHAESVRKETPDER